MSSPAGIGDLNPDRGIIIDGRAIAAETSFEVLDPSTRHLIATVADGTPAHATAAVDAASHALRGWMNTPARARSEILYRAYDRMVDRAEWLASLICLENGKPWQDAQGEVAYAAEFFRWFAEEAVRPDGSYGHAPGGDARTFVTHKPVGVAALITPWNFPAAMMTRKIAPALAAGCTAVVKPAPETPLTALAIATVLREAGLPDGVVNIVPTSKAPELVTRWLCDPRVQKLSFTGSTQVGRLLLSQAAERVLNVSMELGGNAPFIVTQDANIPAAIQGALVAKFRGGGQACTAANRFYIHGAVAEEFTNRFGEAAAGLKVGPARDRTSELGPLISEQALHRVQTLLAKAMAGGATVSHQGKAPSDGWYVPPTVLTNVHWDAEILTTEIFGPVAPIVVWDDETKLLDELRCSDYGLAAYVYADRLQDALRIAESMEVGMVGINRGVVSDPSAPFGGFKQSGLGREGAKDGMREFQETQYFSVDANER